MNRTTINGVVYESKYSMSIINNKVVCDGEYYVNGKLQGKETNESEGQITTKNFEVINIKSLYNSFFTVEVHIDPSIDKEELSITTSESIHKKINVSFNRSNLLIDGSGSMSGQIKVLLKAKSLEKLVNSGFGDVTGSVKTNSLKVENNGTGNIKLNGKTESLSIDNSGVGNIDTIELFAKNVSFSNSGVGNIKVTSKIINGNTSGVGNVKYYADKETKISKSGIGSVKYLGVREFEVNPIEPAPIKSSIKVEHENQKTTVQTQKNDVSLAEIEKQVQENKTIPSKEEKDSPLSSLAKKFKKFL